MLFFGNRLRLAAILSRRARPPLRNSENPIKKGAAADPHRQQHLDGIAYFASAKAAAPEPAMRPQVNALEMVKPM